MNRTILGITIAAAIALSATTGFAQNRASQPDKSPQTTAKDASEACMQMMQGAGVTDEGRKAMQEFMRSDRAPQAMANMMDMARGMGNGDVMLGMTRMMEMMGGTHGGGMMGGRGGMMQPGDGMAAPGDREHNR